MATIKIFGKQFKVHDSVEEFHRGLVKALNNMSDEQRAEWLDGLIIKGGLVKKPCERYVPPPQNEVPTPYWMEDEDEHKK